jgi:hypothetical protein
VMTCIPVVKASRAVSSTRSAVSAGSLGHGDRAGEVVGGSLRVTGAVRVTGGGGLRTCAHASRSDLPAKYANCSLSTP